MTNMTSKSIYVMRSSAGPVKIGIASNVGKRLLSIKTGCPFEVQLAHKKEHETASQVESLAHSLLSEKRMNGEWFDCSVEDAVIAIEQAIEMLADGWRPSKSKRPADGANFTRHT